MEAKKGGFRSKAYRGAQIVAVGGLTGAFAGVVVTCYSALVDLCEEFSRGYYGYFADHPGFIPLLFLALLLGSVVVGGLLMALPILRGTGFPQTEGASMGLVRYKWYQVLPAMFAASLFCIFMGLSAGAEGPGLMIGGACGCGLSDVTRRDATMRRYQITGGACAGLAVALNAPFTGIVFAYEEAYKRFTPEVFSCSFSSVVVAIVIRNVLAPFLGLGTGPVFAFDLQETGLSFLPFALLAGVVVALMGVAFYYSVLLVRRLVRRMTKTRRARLFRLAVPFLLAGVAGLICTDAMGTGVHFMNAVAADAVTPLFASPVWATLLVVVILRYLVSAVNVGADVPCCASFPMMAIGAGTGALLSRLFLRMGMDPACTGVLVVICMVTFFTTVVRAPFTGIVMAAELTWSFTPLLPVLLSVAVGYFVSSILHTEPLYEKLLEEILEEEYGHAKKIVVKVRVTGAAGRAVRDVLWPYTALVTEIVRGAESVAPKGDTVLAEGDVLTVEGAPAYPAEFEKELGATVGEVLTAREGPEELTEGTGEE